MQNKNKAYGANSNTRTSLKPLNPKVSCDLRLVSFIRFAFVLKRQPRHGSGGIGQENRAEWVRLVPKPYGFFKEA